jgi:6-phosphogluconolactonase (cycloisomerase 2 family)
LWLLPGLGAVLLASHAVAATIPVTTTDDTSAVACTLRDAIAAANTDAPSGACPAGAGDDVVDLTGLAGQISIGASALPALATNIHVRGPGSASLTIDGADANRVFDVAGGTVIISDLRIFRGFAPEMFGAGGGVRCIRATLTLSRVVVTGCSAYQGGAALIGECTATIADSTIVANTTTVGVGAGIDSVGSTLTLANTTVSGNINNGMFPGSGLFQSAGAVAITNCTFTGNTGTSLLNNNELDPPEEPDDPATGTLRLANTIIVNDSGPNCSGPITSDGHNLSDDGTCGLTGPGDLQGFPANLGILSNNGGPTPTHAPLPGSVAIDLGGVCPPTDQRGVERPVDGNANGVAECDAGAFERGCEDDLPSGTACAPGTNPCVDDVCDNLTLTCQHASNTAACDDGNACTIADLCGAGVCAGTPVPCPVGGSLTFGTCITAETQSGPTGTNACVQVDIATSFGQDSGFENLRAVVESAEGRSLYVIGGNDDAVAHFDRDPVTGILTYRGCITGETESGPTGTGACAAIGSASTSGQDSGLDLPQSLALSPDGKSLYTASRLDDAVAHFDRDPATGVLAYRGCISGETESAPACTQIGTATASGSNSGLDDLRAVAVSADGRSVYTVSSFDDAVARFDRDPATGVLTYQGCFTGETESATACTAVGGAVSQGANSGLDVLNGLALSADGRSLYTVALLDDAVARFDRDPTTGALTYQGCITGEYESNDTACTTIPAAGSSGLNSGLDELFTLALSPDGTSLYCVSQGDDAVAHFERDTTTGALTYQGCITGEIASGPTPPIPGTGACARTASAALNGSESGFDKLRSVAVTADGRSLYAASPADDSVVHFLREPTGGELLYESCLTGEVATGPAGTNACAAIGSATAFGTDSGVDNPQAFVVSADGRMLYTASGNDAAVARFDLAPEPATTTTSTTLPAVPIAGTALLIADPAERKRKIVFVSKDRRLDTSAGSGIDPVADGALLQVFNDAGTGDSACFDLPAPGWDAKGKPARRTFRYKDKSFARGACRATTVKDGKLLKVVCLAKAKPISYSLDEAAQQRVGVRFRSGATEYCALFGGRVEKDVQRKRFEAKKAPAPAACPVAPAACP